MNTAEMNHLKKKMNHLNKKMKTINREVEINRKIGIERSYIGLEGEVFEAEKRSKKNKKIYLFETLNLKV